MLFKHRKKTNQQEENTQKIIKQESAEFQVVDACEQMIDAAREFEAAREEYAQVTNYLTDIERMENMKDPDKKLMCDAAASIAQLERKRSEFLKTENKISYAHGRRHTGARRYHRWKTKTFLRQNR